MSIASSLRTHRTGRSAASNGSRSVMVSAEVFSVVHQIMHALLQVTHQTRDDAVTRERLLLQQQQILQRDFIEKEMKEKQLQTEREIKKRQLQFEREKMAVETAQKDKQMQLEREIKVTEATEKEKQPLVEKELQEKEMWALEKQKLLEFAEKDKVRLEERAEKDKERIKQEFEAKLELNLQIVEEKRRNVVEY